jgi:hypothetical protein
MMMSMPGMGSAPLASSLAQITMPKMPMVGPGSGSPPSFLDKLLGGMDKKKMRDTGLGLIQQAMQQQQQPSPMQLAPFQPGGGGGMPGGGMQTPALMQLLQQYGMNKIQ